MPPASPSACPRPPLPEALRVAALLIIDKMFSLKRGVSAKSAEWLLRAHMWQPALESTWVRRARAKSKPTQSAFLQTDEEER